MKQHAKITWKEACSNVSAILLAGGKARRMGGINKALLNIDGETIIQREIKTLERLFDNIIIITNSFEQYAFLGKQMFQDIRSGYGSLGGLFTGLSKCSTEYGFVFACDMPFLNEKIVAYICERSIGHDVTVPRIGGWLEPLHAVYSRRCVTFMENLMRLGDLKIINFFHEVDVVEINQEELEQIDPELRFRINVNTPDDLALVIDTSKAESIFS
ncbi:MAG: molybdenum cofactor guanylyltransferase [Deltaproteobacteria bacterium]|nr:molybdenum cofactor guanylyltransferase [Deltaproteobacteria bacterium]